MEWIPDLRQLRAFVAVAEDGSFTLAARRLCVTQSAVSHSLRAMEDQLGCRLLDRHGKRVAVTPEGRLLLKRGKRVLLELDQAVRDLDGFKRWGQKRLRVGATHTLCHFLLPSVLREFTESFSSCEVILESGETPTLLSRLEDSELDLVIGLKPRNHSGQGYLRLFEDELAMVVSSGHAWVREGMNPSESFNAQTFIIDAKATETHRLFLEWLAFHGMTTREPLALGDLQAIRNMARLGVGVAVLAPWMVAGDLMDGSLQVFPLQEPVIRREWCVFGVPGRIHSPVEQTFIGMCSLAAKSLPHAPQVGRGSSE